MPENGHRAECLQKNEGPIRRFVLLYSDNCSCNQWQVIFMDVSPIIDPLNDAQREAVTAQNDHLLVLAGAGSGKTRVLVHRIAWLMQVDKVPASTSK